MGIIKAAMLGRCMSVTGNELSDIHKHLASRLVLFMVDGSWVQLGRASYIHLEGAIQPPRGREPLRYAYR